MSTPKLLKVTLNGKSAQLAEGRLIKSLRKAGITVPSMCYHSDVSSSGGRCRVCLCNVDGKIVTSCNRKVVENSTIITEAPELKQLREAAAILTKINAPTESETKKVMVELPRTRYVTRHPEECVHCNLCIEMCSSVQGVAAIGDVRKHADDDDHEDHGSKIGTFLRTRMPDSECIACGQCINVCPTKALEEWQEGDAFMAALNDPTKVPVVQFAPSVRIALAEEFGSQPGKRNVALEMVAATRRLAKHRSDLVVMDSNLAADFTIMEEGTELLERLRRTLTGEKHYGGDHMETVLPMITSCSPGWVGFAEKNYHDLLPHLSSCKSPMQMAGALAKHYYSKLIGRPPSDVVSLAVMPCVAKKLEKDRPQNVTDGLKDVDRVLTTREFAKLLKKYDIDPTRLDGEPFDEVFGIGSGAGAIFGASGGVMEAAIRTVHVLVTGRDVPFHRLNVTPIRGFEGIKEASLPLTKCLTKYKWLEGVELRVAVSHGLANARRLMDRIRVAKAQGHPPPYHFIEVMACPGGCLGGGGQPKPTSMDIKNERAKLIYRVDEDLAVRMSHEHPTIRRVYKEFLGHPLGPLSHKLLHTTYAPQESESKYIASLPEAQIVQREVLDKFPKNLFSGLTNILCAVVDKYGYVSDPAVAAIAEHVGTMPVTVDAIISHYHYIPRTPKPESMIYLCNCIHCRLHGADLVRDSLKQKDIPFRRASWLGWCVNGAPAALIKTTGDSNVHALYDMKPNDRRLNSIIRSSEEMKTFNIKRFENTNTGVNFDTVTSKRFGLENPPSVLRNIELKEKDKALLAEGKCPVSHTLWQTPPEELISRLKVAGLRGCGGAGFPAHLKWTAVRNQPKEQPRYIVVNADEGLPNTFKDYYLLHEPSCRMRMIIGMCIAAQSVGANRIYMYLRFEYKNLVPAIYESFEKYKKLNPFLSDELHFEIILGAGPYICGEETALFESVEGQAPQARASRALYPTQRGLFSKPTLVHNVETLAWVPGILYHGGEWYKQVGGIGMKLLSISGNVKRATLAEVPFGTTIRDMLKDCAKVPMDEIASVEIGGILEMPTFPKDFDKKLTLDGKPGTVPAGGSVVVFSKNAILKEEDVFQRKANFASFESCQLCAPCREGSKFAAKRMKALFSGSASISNEEIEILKDLASTMETTSNCGHGKACGTFLLNLLEQREQRIKEPMQAQK